ncbi:MULTISPECIES: ATP-binding protein [Streptomyces]|uniref:ATP-binding protein n=1 Tax=Streptomyces TaxID=1883 RepID=UPI001E4408CC|nr:MULTISPECIES: ATP-binding protein [Streptomyces]
MIPQLPLLGAAVHPCVLQLSATPRGARLGRLLAIEQLRAWGVPWERPERILDELLANAVTHGRVPGRDFRLALAVHPTGIVRIEVTDTRYDRMPDPTTGGRGLAIVEELADCWGVVTGPPPWKTVYAEVSPYRAPAPEIHDSVDRATEARETAAHEVMERTEERNPPTHPPTDRT